MQEVREAKSCLRDLNELDKGGVWVTNLVYVIEDEYSLESFAEERGECSMAIISLRIEQRKRRIQASLQSM